MKQRLLIFHFAIAPYRVDFFNELGRRFRCRVVFEHREVEGVLAHQQQLLADATYEVGYLPPRRKVCGRMVGGGYWNEIRRFRPDVVLCSEFGMGTLACAAYRLLHIRHPRVFTLCDDSPDMVAACRGWRRRRRWLLLRALDGMVSVNEPVAQLYRSDYGVRHAAYFPIIYDERTFRRSDAGRLAIARRLVGGYELAGRTVALFVGRFIPEKNLPALLRAFAKVLEHPEVGRRALLVLVGDGTLGGELRAQVEALGLQGHVLMPGRVEGEALLAWYHTADFLVLPSRKEAFGAVVGEALLSGCRALVSCHAGAHHLVDTTNGGVFCPDDEAAFAEALLAMFRQAQPTPPEAFCRPSRMVVRFDERMDALEKLLAGDAPGTPAKENEQST